VIEGEPGAGDARHHGQGTPAAACSRDVDAIVAPRSTGGPVLMVSQAAVG